MKKVRLAAFFWVCFFMAWGSLLALAADLSGNAQAGVGTDRKILRFAIHTSGIGNFDPDYAKGSQDYTYADMVFNSLLRHVPGDSSQMEPDLAAAMPEFEIHQGRQIWTIQLRKGVFFHAGPHTPAHELTAEDVVYSLKKAADPGQSDFFGAYEHMEFEVNDPYTLRIIVQKPMSPLFFLPCIANREGGFILSKQVMETAGYEGYKQHPVGTGPFKFSGYIAGEKLILTANDNYFRGQPKLSGVEIHFIPDNKARVAAYKSGQVDGIYGVGDPGWIEQMETEPNTRVDVFGPGSTGLLHFNSALKPMDDIRVRQAITCALDRNQFLTATSLRFVTPVYGPMPFLPGGLSNEKVTSLGLYTPRNLERARQLLAEAGYAKGFTMDLVTSEKRIYKKIYEILKEQLEKIGIRVTLDVVAHSLMHKRIRENVNPIVLYFTFRPNADYYLRGFFHSHSIVVTGEKPHTNFSHYRKIDRLLDDALHEIHPQHQINLWKQAQIRILHDAMVYPLFNVNQCSVRRDHVDYGHPLISTLSGYPQFTEKTMLHP